MIEVNEGMDLKPDGTVRWSWADEVGELVVITMRRPSLGEFRKLREKLHQLQDEAAGARAEVAVVTAELTQAVQAQAGEGQSANVEGLGAMRDKIRAQTQLIESGDLGWLRAAFEMLGKPALPADDDLPAWFMGGGTLINDLVAHWRARPLALGGA